MTTTFKVKNGLLKLLPKELQNAWNGADVLMRVSMDTLILKKIQTDSFWQSWRQVKPLAAGISPKDIRAAVSWARKKQK